MTLPVGALGGNGVAAGSSMWGRGDPAGEILELADLVHHPAWHAGAACRDHPELSWFPALGVRVDAIKAICAACPVRSDCLAWALSQGPELQGWWGGLGDRTRRRMRKS